MSYDCSRKLVSITWRHHYVFTEQVLDLPYYPTSVVCLESGSTGLDLLCLAGKYEDGDTVLELIALRQATVLRDPQTGDRSLALGSAEAIHDLYRGAVVGRDMIRFIKGVRGRRDLLLVKFADSGALATVSTLTGEVRMQATVDGTGGSRAVPELRYFYGDMWAGSHCLLGDVYVLVNDLHLPSSFPPPIVLIDSDGDGDMEHSLVPRGAWWGANGMSNASNYLDW